MRVNPTKNLSVVPQKVIDRFWKYVNKTPGCWLWTGPRMRNKYGVERAVLWIQPTYYLASRLSWNIHYGEILGGLWALHKCDNTMCVKNVHLFLGNHKANMRDMVLKNRVARGERGGRAILKTENIQEIFRLSKEGFRHWQMAKKFGVSRPTITAVLNHRIWKHIPVTL